MKASIWMATVVSTCLAMAPISWAEDGKWFAHSSYAVNEQHSAAMDVVKDWASDATSHIAGAVDYQYKVRSTSSGQH
ncbi:hypothetical protein GYB62_03550, partial [bacterium]|nr:hypothetical protein [bacterium]